MVTELDEGRGLVKSYWSEIRTRVSKVEPIFAELVDALDVDKTFPLYLAYYPYGALKGDTQSTLLPHCDGGFYRLTDPDAPKDVVKHLGYSKNGAPLAMLLDKSLELFIDLKEEKLTIPRALYLPGAFFPFARILSSKSQRTYAPNGVLTLTSGARSVFMLPNIGCATHHASLRNDFNIQSSPTKNLYDQWFLFTEILNTEMINCDWRSCLIYFSQKWLDKLFSDKAWLNLRLYLHELAWQHYEYSRNHFYYDVAFSMIQKKRNLKPNPYLVDTARHLFAIALGASPGFAPATNNQALPAEILQNVFIESYGLKKYFPTILHPTHFNYEEDQYPVYYSLQNPSTHMFSPKSRRASSTISEMRELEYIMRIFSQGLARSEGLCSDTIMGKIASDAEFKYFHNKADRHGIVLSSTEIGKLDKRFLLKNKKNPDATFASDSPFVRGCISVKAKNQVKI